MSTSSLEDRRELGAVVRRLLEKRSAEPAVREAMESPSGHDLVLWVTFADELGLQGLAVPEAYGGSGAGYAELAIVCEELGRSLACTPYLATVVLGAGALLASGDPGACERWLPGIVDGTLTATAALDAGSSVTARRAGDGWLLTGAIAHLLDGASADLLVLLAATPEGPSLFAVEGLSAAPGAAVTTIATSDLTRRIAALELADTPAVLVGDAGAGASAADAALAAAMVALAAEQVGGAAAALDMAVGYAKTRHQFGRPIGSFQAIKHKCADMLVAVESARSAVWAAARALDDEATEAAEASLLVLIASSVCSEAYLRCASDNVQVHGGIGFTWEHPAQLHVKRSRGSAVLLGTPAEHRAQLVDLVPILATQGVTS
ncbi:MAG: Acyl-CoA dehydrogenase [Marmoricola sp.]|nr:Acyl-CoA dehydrogenase [Marmoricola sp.]